MMRRFRTEIGRVKALSLDLEELEEDAVEDEIAGNECQRVTQSTCPCGKAF